MIAALLIGLSGCDKAEKVGDTVKDISKEVSKNVSSESGDTAYVNKVSGYVGINNDFVSYWRGGMLDSSYFQEQRAKAKAKVEKGDFKLITSGDSLDRAAEKIAKHQEKYAGTELAELDKAAKALADTINQYRPKWKELEEYNKAKRYEDDNGAKGKELLPNYLEAQTKIREAYEAFDGIAKQEAKKAKEIRIAQMKKEGLTYDLYTEEALAKAEQIVELFGDEKSLKDKAKIEEGNQLLVEMEKDLEELKKAAEEKKESLSLHDSMIRFTAEYREFRKTPSARNYNDLVSKYNSTVESYNRAQSFRRK